MLARNSRAATAAHLPVLMVSIMRAESTDAKRRNHQPLSEMMPTYVHYFLPTDLMTKRYRYTDLRVRLQHNRIGVAATIGLPPMSHAARS
jgi:hypothetical protein